MAKKQTKVSTENVLVIGEDVLKDKIHLIRGQKGDVGCGFGGDLWI